MSNVFLVYELGRLLIHFASFRNVCEMHLHAAFKHMHTTAASIIMKKKIKKTHHAQAIYSRHRDLRYSHTL